MTVHFIQTQMRICNKPLDVGNDHTATPRSFNFTECCKGEKVSNATEVLKGKCDRTRTLQ